MSDYRTAPLMIGTYERLDRELHKERKKVKILKEALMAMKKDIVRSVDIEVDFPDTMDISTVMNAKQYKAMREALKRVEEMEKGDDLP